MYVPASSSNENVTVWLDFMEIRIDKSDRFPRTLT